MAVTVKAIGSEKSWGDSWAQHQVDHLFAVMFAIAHADDFTLQMRQANQPLTRAEGSVFAQAMLKVIGVDPPGREAYLNGIARRIHGKPLCDVTDAEWRDILGALHHTAQHKAGKAHSHPRSPWQGRKGEKNAGSRAAGIDVNKGAMPVYTVSRATEEPENPF